MNLATWTGFGSILYWNRLRRGDPDARIGHVLRRSSQGLLRQFPIAARSGSGNRRGPPDQITTKLAALHFYQPALPAPPAPGASYDRAAAARGGALFTGKAKCATCHVPPLYTEPGQNLHSASEIGVDSFQADRSPTHAYRTAPLKGLWTHQRAASTMTAASRGSGRSLNTTMVALRARVLTETEAKGLRRAPQVPLRFRLASPARDRVAQGGRSGMAYKMPLLRFRVP